MIAKNDVLLLLSDLKDAGVSTTDAVNRLLSSRDVPIDVLQFINEHRQLDLVKFYEKLRKSYNNKHSKLYVSIIKGVEGSEDVLTTLSSLNLQILLFSKNVSDRQMFLKHARAKEINLVLTKYFTDYDLTSCVKLLRLIRADIIASEVINERRQLEDTDS